MRILIMLPLLFLGIKSTAQFNTASYKAEISSIELKEFSSNQFQGTFLDYHLEGTFNKKRMKEARKKEKEEKKLQLEAEKNKVAAKENDTIVLKDLPKNEEPLKPEIKIEYRKLDLIKEPQIEKQQLVYMPLNDIVVTSNYGNRYHPIEKVLKSHDGIDLRANNDLVFSVLDGVISDAGYTEINGNYIKIKHESFETMYLHLDKFYYIKGDIIKAGDIIAISGNTGRSTAPHLHFAVKENGVFINPIQFLNDLITTNNALIDYGKQ